MHRTHRPKIRPNAGPTIFALALVFVSYPASGNTANGASLAQILKRAAKITDDVPLKSTDDVVARLKKLPTFRPTKSGLELAGETTLKSADELRAAAILMDGAKRIDKSIPDLAARTDLIRRSGPDALMAAGARPEAASDLLYLSYYLDRAKGFPDLPRSPTMADFADVATDEARWKFWNKYVKPYKKQWATGGALALYLTAPEMWHDQLGNITEKGVMLAGDLGGEVLGGAMDGLRTGGKKLGEQTAKAILPNASNSLMTWIGMAAILTVFAFLISAALRRRAYSFFKKLFFGKPNSNSNSF
ncbi:MAG: hypothetical protein ACR2NF_03110 [Pirellulales bacterium]